MASGGENVGVAEGESDRAIWLRGEYMRQPPTKQAKCPDVAFVQSSGAPMSVRRVGHGLDQNGLERRRTAHEAQFGTVSRHQAAV